MSPSHPIPGMRGGSPVYFLATSVAATGHATGAVGSGFRLRFRRACTTHHRTMHRTPGGGRRFSCRCVNLKCDRSTQTETTDQIRILGNSLRPRLEMI